MTTSVNAVYIYPDGAPDFREAVYVSSLYFDKVYDSSTCCARR